MSYLASLTMALLTLLSGCQPAPPQPLQWTCVGMIHDTAKPGFVASPHPTMPGWIDLASLDCRPTRNAQGELPAYTEAERQHAIANLKRDLGL